MHISTALLYLWGALFLSFMALLVYRGQLTRYEDDQLFLNEDAFTVRKNKQHHEELLRKLSKIRPIFQSCAVAAGLVTAMVVGMYVYNAWQSIP